MRQFPATIGAASNTPADKKRQSSEFPTIISRVLAISFQSLNCAGAFLMDLDFSTIPVVDWQRLQDPGTKPHALAQLREAIFQVGFLYLTNHGLEDLIRRTHDKLPELFDLPDEVKERCNMINSPSFVGYTRLGAETTASKTDWREVCAVQIPMMFFHPIVWVAV